MSLYPPTVPTPVMQPHEPTEVVNPHPPTEVDRQGAVSRSDPAVVAPQAPVNPASREQATVIPAKQPDLARPEPPTALAPGIAPRQPAPEVVRYGPGVPPSQAGVSAEQVWRTGRMPEPPRRPVRRLRRLAGTAVTVILLAAAGVLLFLRFYHPAFKVTGASIIESVQNGCTVNVTGRITTNGAAGTISYQWVFTPQHSAPQPLSQSVVSGQHASYVTVSIQGQGHGSATQKVTLQVLGPNQETGSRVVKISC